MKQSGTLRETGPFFEHVKKEGKPALAALIGNAFRIREDRGTLTFMFDRSHANLIPMIKSMQNIKLLESLCESFFEKKFDLNFAIGSDPAIRKRKEREVEAREIALANPKVKFIMENFGGTIVRCEPPAEETSGE